MKLFCPALGATALAFFIVSIAAHAESLRCDGDLAQIRDSKATVLAKCGEPMLKDSFCKPVEQSTTVQNSENKATTIINVMPCESVDEWTYNPGSGQFLTTLRFERGELKSMKYGARVP